jgi:DNA primase
VKVSKDLSGNESGLGFDSVSVEREERLLKDCFKRIKDHYLKAQADKLTLELKQESSPEKLEQLMKLQRDRMALNKES